VISYREVVWFYQVVSCISCIVRETEWSADDQVVASDIDAHGIHDMWLHVVRDLNG